MVRLEESARSGLRAAEQVGEKCLSLRPAITCSGKRIIVSGYAASRSQPTKKKSNRSELHHLRDAMIITLHHDIISRCHWPIILLLILLGSVSASAQTSHSTDGTT